MFKRIGVIGAGAMGRGIAQLFASSGQQVLLFDTRAEAIDEALAFNRNLLQRAQAKGKLTEAELEATVARMQPAAKLSDLADCDLVIEAIVELLEVKQKLFADLEAIVSADCVLATNTSSLSVTRIASTAVDENRRGRARRAHRRASHPGAGGAGRPGWSLPGDHPGHPRLPGQPRRSRLRH